MSNYNFILFFIINSLESFSKLKNSYSVTFKYKQSHNNLSFILSIIFILIEI